MALAIVALLLIAGLHVSTAAVYIVGDSAGWTTLGNVDYRRWAANKTFHVGDVILFKYHPQFHNVMQVTRSAYKSCNASAPIATHTTGNDSITISTPGHHFFLCGVPGHCQAGQKIDINMPGAVRSPILPVSPSPSPSTTTTVITPPPSPSGTAPLIMYGLIGIVGKLGLSMAFFAAFVSG